MGRGVFVRLGRSSTPLPARAHSARADLPLKGGGDRSKLSAICDCPPPQGGRCPEHVAPMITPRRLVTAERREEDVAEAPLRPQRLDEFIGQAQARSNLEVFIAAAKSRREALGHVLFVGPPGLGKTTLGQIAAPELGVNFLATYGTGVRNGSQLSWPPTNHQ